MIQVQNLTHRYGDRLALSNVSFEVEKGEIFGLLGPNGGGKSTLFRILSTMMVPTGGRAIIGGHDVEREPAAVRRHIGVVFQTQSLDKALTVAENLRAQGHLHGLRGVLLGDRMERAMERLGLADRRRDLSRHIESLRTGDGVTILLTTHILEEAGRCDRLVLLHQGNMVAEGTPAELRARIGGDVVVLQTADTALLAAKIEQRFGVRPVVRDGEVRVEIANGHRFIAEVVEAFPGAIESVGLHKPTLEDVFVNQTGASIE